MEAASLKQTARVKVASRLWLEPTVAGPCVDHSAAMCLFFMFTVQPMSRDQASLLPQAFLSPVSPLLSYPLSPAPHLPAGFTVLCVDVSCGDDRPAWLKL